MKDLQLRPNHLSFMSIIKREETKRKRKSYFKKANLKGRVRRQKLAKEQRENDLLSKEGRRSYKSSSFGLETFFKHIRRCRRIVTMKSTREKAHKRQYEDTSENFICPVDLNLPSDSDEINYLIT